MKLIGVTLLIFGLGPVFAEYIGRDVIFFAWTDSWGVEASLILKAAMITFGAALFLPGGRPQQKRHSGHRNGPRWIPSRGDVKHHDPVAELYNNPAH